MKPKQDNKSDNQIRNVLIYQINFWALEACLFGSTLMTWIFIPLPLELHVSEGGFIFHKTSETVFAYVEIGLFLFFTISFFGAFLWKLTNNWKYTIWNRRKIPYIQLNEESLTLFGETSIPWSCISYIQRAKMEFRGPFRTYLIIGLADEWQRNRQRIANVDRLTKSNSLARSLYREEFKIDIDQEEFLSVFLDDKNGLTLPSNEIITLTQKFWNLGIDTEMKTSDGRPVKAIAGEKTETISGGSTNSDKDLGRISKSTENIATRNGHQITKLDGSIKFRVIIIIALSSILLSISTTNLYRLAKSEWEMETWPSVTGTMTASSVGTGCVSLSEFWPDLKYKYSVNGVDYVGSKVDAIDLSLRERVNLSRSVHMDFDIAKNRCMSNTAISKLKSLYPVGNAVNVYFNPISPKESILVKPSVEPTVWTEFVVILLIFFALLFVAIRYFRIAIGI